MGGFATRTVTKKKGYVRIVHIPGTQDVETMAEQQDSDGASAVAENEEKAPVSIQGPLQPQGKLPIANKTALSSVTLLHALCTGDEHIIKEPEAQQPTDA